jgi:diacylglycerol kinase (ATP)
MRGVWLPPVSPKQSPPPQKPLPERPSGAAAAAPPRHLLLIANPVSGGGRGRVAALALQQALAGRGITADVHLTQRAGDAAERARRAGAEPFDGLVAIGGDGTVNEVLHGMPDPTRPLGVLPVGTANVLACELGLPAAPNAAAAVLAAGALRELAIGLVGERRFLLFVGVGVDGAVVERLSAVRSGTLGKRKWAGPILHTLWHWPQFRLRAELADGTVLEDLSSVLVTRVRNYGGLLRLPKSVDADSGLLHVLGFRQRRRLGWLWQGLRGFTRTMREGRGLVVAATTHVRVTGDAPLQIDGDFGGRAAFATPVEIALLPAHARIYAPARR